MKFTKKTLAIVVALAIVLTSISIAVFADDKGELTTTTNFSRYVDGTWKELDDSDSLEYAKPGDFVKADVYLTSDFLVGGIRLIMAYDDILSIDTSRSTESATEGVYNVDSSVGIKGTFKDGQATADSLVTKGVVTSADTAGLKFYDVKTNASNKIQKYDNTLAMTFYFVVSDSVTATDTAELSVFPDTTKSPSSISLPSEADFVTDDSFDGQKVSALDDEYETAAEYDLTITSSSEALVFGGKAAFNANGENATFADGSATADVTGIYGAAATAPADPTREGYEFKGWATTADATAADATTFELGSTVEPTNYYAVWEIKSYTITFADEDGTVLQSGKVNYGETPSYTGTPTKAADEQYTYIFNTWTPAIEKVTKDQTYTATYTPTTRQYTVTFYDEDGTTVLQQSKWDYNATPTYTATEPTKAATAEKTYTFAGWDKAISPVTGDQEYKAVYTDVTNKYTVIFANYDGTELQKTEELYGAMPSYTGTPTKAATAEKTYTFAGWDKEISPVTGDVTYTATFKEAAQEYTVTFKNDDGTVLQTGNVKYGETPSYTGIPTKAADAQYTYTFDTWTPTIVPVTADAEYTATYTKATRTYSITFTDDNGNALQTSEVPYGDTPAYTGETPTKAADDQYEYTFAGWDPEIVAVTGEATYKPVWTKTPVPATITDVFEYIVNADNGTTYVYGTPETKTGKEATTYDVPAITVPEGYSTTATQWTTAEGTAATGTFGTANAVYQVVITPNKYTLTVKDADGNVVDTQDVTFDSEIPNPSASLVPAEITDAEGKTLEFRGWTSDPAGYEPGAKMPAQAVTLTPVYTEKQTQYTARFYKDSDKTQLYTTEDVKTGETIPDPGTPKKFGYVFAGWENADGYTVGGAMPAQDVEFTAKWELDKTMIAIVVGGVVIGGGIAGTAAAVNTALITGAAIVGGVAVIGGAIYLSKNTHTVTYYVDGEVYKTFYVIEGTKVIEPSDPTKSGYTFAGWDEEIPDTMPDHDLSFNAKWVAGENAAVVDGNIPDTGSATAGIAALAMIASAAGAAYVITTRKKDED